MSVSIYYLLYGALEQEFGVFNADGATTLLPYYSTSVQRNESRSDEKLIKSGVRSVTQPSIKEIEVSGSIDVPVDENAIIFWLSALLGGVYEDQSNETAQKKIYRPEQAFDLPSICTCQGFKGRTDYYRLGSGIVVNDMNLSLTAGDIKCSFGLLGRDLQYVDTNGSYPFSEDKTGAVKPETKLYTTAEASLSVNNVDKLGDFTEFTLNFSNNASSVRNIKSNGFVSGFRPKSLKITGNVKGLVSKSLIDMGVSSSLFSVEFELKSSTSTIKIHLPQTSFMNPKDTISGDEEVYVDMDFESYEGASAMMVEYIVPVS